MTDHPLRPFHLVITPLFEPALARLARDLDGNRRLGVAERQAIIDGLTDTLRDKVLGKVSRVLLLELHAARITGRLTAADTAGRWEEWLTLARRPDFWSSLTQRYPTLLDRLSVMIDNICRATGELAHRFGADRPQLARLCAGEPELTALSLGAGDSHRGGSTVGLLTTTAGRLVYKPRSLRLDAVLAEFLHKVLSDSAEARIRVPEVVDRGSHGWAEYITHRYCRDDAELRSFYRGLGYWSALSRLFNASDLHSENLIAAGPVPVVVDCETIFARRSPQPPTGLGAAWDKAVELIRRSPLHSGLLPGRGAYLAFRGVDASAAGALPDEQPLVRIPTITGIGTDEARLTMEAVPRSPANNLPSPTPRIGEFWPQVVAGFDELTARLAALDRTGALDTLIAAFDDAPIRLVLRDTITYAEIGAMLWHPASLHNEAEARERAIDLLTKNAANNPDAPSDPRVIRAEVAELLVGDVPYFVTEPTSGNLTGPGGIVAGIAAGLPKKALARWRELDLTLDRQIVESAVVNAYRDESSQPVHRSLLPSRSNTANLDRRRRRVAADLIRLAHEQAITAEDGTISWIAPVLGPTGPAVQPLGFDIYSGLPGVATMLAAYQHEVTAGRADPVPEAAAMLNRILHTLRLGEEKAAENRRAATGPTRPASTGGYAGIASRIWAWLLLKRFGVITSEESIARSLTLAELLPEAVAQDEEHDLLQGSSGAIVCLLRFAQLTDDSRWRSLAITIGDRLVDKAVFEEGRARWPIPLSPHGLGGVAHGAAGIGWALARLALDTGETRFRDLADAAFAFQDSLWMPEFDNWRDLRKPKAVTTHWCHGSSGLAVVAADLMGRDTDSPERWRTTLTQAARAGWANGFGETHTICHGDLGTWEALDLAISARVAPDGVTRERIDAHVISSVEEYGAQCAMSNSLFRPGLLNGAGGVVYQLLRMHPDSPLPSLMLPDPAGSYRRGTPPGQVSGDLAGRRTA
jgi:type 2 lantibiotic biosynthesis protein LanM